MKRASDFDSNAFALRHSKGFRLKNVATAVRPFYSSEADYEARLQTLKDELAREQDKLYAGNRYALLLIFQGMDASGKDGLIKHVMSAFNPQGCQVTSFKQPTNEELDHDYLWRCVRRLPERGRVGIFNRSYYEEVLVVRVHPDILRAQKLPREWLKPGQKFWRRRFDDITAFEKYLRHNGVMILKFFLHVSKAEQKRRLLERLDNPHKHWKFNLGDVRERTFWPSYQKAYEQMLRQTSTRHNPWHAIPADDKKNARLIVSEIILEHLQALHLEYPDADAATRRGFAQARRLLAR